MYRLSELSEKFEKWGQGSFQVKKAHHNFLERYECYARRLSSLRRALSLLFHAYPSIPDLSAQERQNRPYRQHEQVVMFPYIMN
jgi:hypothetical protein